MTSTDALTLPAAPPVVKIVYNVSILTTTNGYYHFYHKNQGIAWIVIVYTAMANMKTLFIDVPGL